MGQGRDVGAELLVQGRILQTECCPEPLDGLGVEIPLKAREEHTGWVAGHEPGNQKVQHNRDHRCDDVKAQATGKPACCSSHLAAKRVMTSRQAGTELGLRGA